MMIYIEQWKNPKIGFSGSLWETSPSDQKASIKVTIYILPQGDFYFWRKKMSLPKYLRDHKISRDYKKKIQKLFYNSLFFKVTIGRLKFAESIVFSKIMVKVKFKK